MESRSAQGSVSDERLKWDEEWEIREECMSRLHLHHRLHHRYCHHRHLHLRYYCRRRLKEAEQKQGWALTKERPGEWTLPRA